jgi:hypothetical protein
MSGISRGEKINRMTSHAEETLRQFGTRRIAEEFLTMYENYRELAIMATNGQFEDIWSHEELMKFLKHGEF